MIDESLPEVVQNFLRSGHKLERIVLHENGVWRHEGLDFENPRIIDLFSRSVGRTTGGTWILEVGTFTYPIEVERTGFFVTRVDFKTGLITLSDHTTEPLDASTLHYEPDGKLFCWVKSGAFEARFLKDAYYMFAQHIEGDENDLHVEWQGGEYPIRQN